MSNSKKYVYTSDMDEISGMGGGYEEACRKMVIAGLEFFDKQPESFNPRYKGLEDVYGICVDDNLDAKKLDKVILDSVNNDCTGAMHQAAISHIFFIKRNGWEKYKEEMRKRK